MASPLLKESIHKYVKLEGAETEQSAYERREMREDGAGRRGVCPLRRGWAYSRPPSLDCAHDL